MRHEAAPPVGRDASAAGSRVASPLAALLQHLEEALASVALVLVIGSVTWGVLSRYVSRQPAPWANEVATLAFAWLIFIGAAACFKHGMHPSIDMVVKRLPASAARAAQALTHALTLGFCALMVWLGITFSIAAWASPTPVLRLPMTVVYGPVTLGFALMFVRYVQFVLLGQPRSTGAEAP